MSISETRIITKTTPIYTLSFTGVNAPDTYEIQVYKLDSGGYLANYMLAYRNDELLYWGYPYEFARDKDPLLNEMGEKVIQQIMQYKAAQKQINQFP
ncbi:MAG: hypothetical protein K9N06_13315 [Candidatus Cloacimonetes bacterium]|nr:hypothetical protein [Candidatus Cloacimonadota bacterium]